MRFIYCLKKKEVIDKFKLFVKLAEKECGHKIKALQSDNGTEFVNEKMQEFIVENGIRHRRSVPYTPEQNGCAEREAARSIIH